MINSDKRNVLVWIIMSFIRKKNNDNLKIQISCKQLDYKLYTHPTDCKVIPITIMITHVTQISQANKKELNNKKASDD